MPFLTARATYIYIYIIERSSRVDRDIAGTKKHLSSQGFLNPVVSCPNMEGVKDNNAGVNKLALLQT